MARLQHIEAIGFCRNFCAPQKIALGSPKLFQLPHSLPHGLGGWGVQDFRGVRKVADVAHLDEPGKG